MMYDSDVSDEDWARIAHFFEKTNPKGRSATHSKRQIVNGILYINKTGCQWRMLPHDFPCWQTVYGYFQIWNKRNIWEKLSHELNKTYRIAVKKTLIPATAS